MGKSFQEKRSSGRSKAKVSVEILHEDLQGTYTQSVNISENGSLILKMNDAELIEVGMNFDVRITGLMGEAPKVVSAQVVRIDEHGIALQFQESFK